MYRTKTVLAKLDISIYDFLELKCRPFILALPPAKNRTFFLPNLITSRNGYHFRIRRQTVSLRFHFEENFDWIRTSIELSISRWSTLFLCYHIPMGIIAFLQHLCMVFSILSLGKCEEAQVIRLSKFHNNKLIQNAQVRLEISHTRLTQQPICMWTPIDWVWLRWLFNWTRVCTGKFWNWVHLWVFFWDAREWNGFGWHPDCKAPSGFDVPVKLGSAKLDYWENWF